MKVQIIRILFGITLFFSGQLQDSIAQDKYLGVDLSYVNELEDCGVVYYDAEGVARDPYELLAEKGANLVRLRLWHSPEWTNYSNFLDVRKAISRSRASGMAVMLDFHYSDFWADPSRQWRPAAWNDVSDDSVLGDSLYQYTYNTLKALADENLLPEIVQIGNETNGNILIKRTTQAIDGSSPGMFPINWSRMVSLLHSGISAVNQINTDLGANVKTLIHIAQPENALWWFKDAVANGLSGFDIIGISYYPQWSDYNVREMTSALQTLKNDYSKEVMIVETGYPWTTGGNDGAGNVLGSSSRLAEYGNQISREVQRDFLTEMCYLSFDKGATAVVYWEPAWVSSSCKTYWGTGSHYENATMFDFDNRLHTGSDYLGYDYSIIPPALENQDVSFIVNMYGEETANGVFITGDFTGKEWKFISMENTGNSMYRLDTLIPGRTIGAYIFYNKNEWNNLYRETVPESCAEQWGTHRQYIITNKSETYQFAWESCTSNPSGVTSIEAIPGIYPVPADSQLRIDIREPILNVRVSGINGHTGEVGFEQGGAIDIHALLPGIYVLCITTDSATYNYRFIKI